MTDRKNHSRLDDAERAAASIHRQTSPEFIANLKDLL